MEQELPHVLFSADGKGRWFRREWWPQCTETVFLGDQCQGVAGHKGVHWCYAPSGRFMWQDNDDDSTENGCSGDIPPDSDDYKTPLEMLPQYYMKHFQDSEVLDPNEIARLEREDMKENETLDRPISFNPFEKKP